MVLCVLVIHHGQKTMAPDQELAFNPQETRERYEEAGLTGFVAFVDYLVRAQENGKIIKKVGMLLDPHNVTDKPFSSNLTSFLWQINVGNKDVPPLDQLALFSQVVHRVDPEKLKLVDRGFQEFVLAIQCIESGDYEVVDYFDSSERRREEAWENEGGSLCEAKGGYVEHD